MAELAAALFWPALAGYGEAALAYLGEVVRPGRAARLAIWGVRLGWLAQTALLAVQAAREQGFPWTSWAGSLNLFVWLTVGSYLFWGCRARYRLLGLAVMPLAAALLALAWLAGGDERGAHLRFGDAFLGVHIGLALAAFAGFTLAAALAALYLWQERRLKRHAATVLRRPAPSLDSLDRFIGRTVALALPALTLAMGVGFARLEQEGEGLDATIVATLAAWIVYAAYLVLRFEFDWRGRRCARVALAGFVLVILIRVVLAPLGHF